MPSKPSLQLNLESAIATHDSDAVRELIEAGADIEQACTGPLSAWFAGDVGASGLTIGGALVYRYVSGISPDRDVHSVRAAFEMAPSGASWDRLPRAWVEGCVPPGELSNTVFDQLLLLSRPSADHTQKSVFKLYGPSCAGIILGGLDLDGEALKSDLEQLLIRQMQYDDALSSRLRESHLSLQLALRYVDKVGYFPASLLAEMERLPYVFNNDECPLLYFLVEQAASTKAQDWARQAVFRAVEAGANPNVEASSGRTTLMQAAFHGLPEVMGALLEAGADIDRQDRRKWTAKTYAKKPNVKASRDGKHAAAVLLEAWRAKQAIRKAITQVRPA